jgi:DNA polymerase-3 subunit gamma/tau
MRGTDAADPRLVLEVALVRLSRRDAGPPLQMLIERIERLERGAAGGAVASAPAARSPGRSAPADPDPAPAGGGSPRASSGRPALGALRGAPAAAAEATPAPAPDPEPAPAPTGPAREIELDDVIVAWAEILPELPMATRTAVQTAQPLRLEGAVIVFGVPPNLIEAAKPRFHRAADSIREAFSRRLGQTMKFKITAAEDFTAINPGVNPGVNPSPAPAPAKRAGAKRGAAPRVEDDPPIGEPPPDDDEHIDLTETVDAGPVDAAVSSVGLLEQQLGATVVEEKARD